MGRLTRLVSFCCFSMALHGATYYVAPYGTNSSSGLTTNAADAWATVNYAATNAIVAAGDTVNVLEGTYQERVAIGKDGSAGSYIVFQGYPGHTAILNGSNLSTNGGPVIKLTNASYVKVKDLTVTKAPDGGIEALVTTGTEAHIEITGNRIIDGQQEDEGGNKPQGGHGILVWKTWAAADANWHDVLISGNVVSNWWTGLGNEAITLAGRATQCQIVSNTVADVNGIGIDFIGKSTNFPQYCRAAYNLTTNIGSASIGRWSPGASQSSASGIYVDGGKQIVIEHNTVLNGRHGIAPGIEEWTHTVDLSTEGIIVRRNVAKDNRTSNFMLGGGGLGTNGNGAFIEHFNDRICHNTSIGTTTNSTDNKSLVQHGAGIGHVFKNNITANYEPTSTFYPRSVWYTTGVNYTNTLDWNLHYVAQDGYKWGQDETFYANFAAYVAGTTQDSNSITDDPMLVGVSEGDYNLENGSPAIDAGCFLTTANGTDSGTSLVVVDSLWFTSGYGISNVVGDVIQLEGQAATATVTDVDYATHTLTLDTSLEWEDGQGVSYSYTLTAPDIGAFEAGELPRSASLASGGTWRQGTLR